MRGREQEEGNTMKLVARMKKKESEQARKLTQSIVHKCVFMGCCVVCASVSLKWHENN